MILTSSAEELRILNSQQYQRVELPLFLLIKHDTPKYQDKIFYLAAAILFPGGHKILFHRNTRDAF